MVIDYLDFTRAEARLVWRRSTPKTLVHRSYIGDIDDAEDIGLQALVRTAQSWPLPCHICKGEKVMFSLSEGVYTKCGECGGTGAPHNLHTAVHAYLRLAILTQVRNEVNRRAEEARAQISHSRDLRQTGNFRTGRGILKDWSGGDLPTASGLRVERTSSQIGTGLRVWTAGAQITSGPVRNLADTQFIDISPLTGVIWLRPSDKLLREYPARDLRQPAVWEEFTASYKAELRRSITKNPDEWRALLDEVSVVLTCTCRDGARCHRSVLAGVLEGAGAVWEGELVASTSLS